MPTLTEATFLAEVQATACESISLIFKTSGSCIMPSSTCSVVAVVLFLALLAGKGNAFEVSVESISEFYLPTSVGGVPELDEGAGEQFDLDVKAEIAYVVGETGVVNVVDYSNAKTPKLLETFEISSTGTDIEVCDGIVAVGMEGAENKQQLGKIAFYDTYQGGKGTVLKYEIETGYLPDMIHWTSDCKTIVVANEGEGAVIGESLVNPPGSVGVIRWEDNDKSKAPIYLDLTFDDFDGADYYKPDGTGVLWAYRPDNEIADDGQSTFQRDLEPEYIAFNEDETKAYVILQENNAVATVSLGKNPKIRKLSALGLKSWENLYIDASNRDSAEGEEMVNMVTGYKIYGAYQPDTIKSFKGKDGKDYLVTANEGDAKEYLTDDDEEDDVWIEEMRGADLAEEMELSGEAAEMKSFLEDEKALGRLKFLNRHGLDENGAVKCLIAMGGRGVSFFDMSGGKASLAWDSGDEIERLHEQYDPDGAKGVFNPELVDDEDDPATCCFDGRSDDKGAETESIETGICGGHKLLFVGNERSSTLVIYDITKFPNQDPEVLTFMPLANPDMSTTETWQELFDNGNVGIIDPESMKYVKTSHSSGVLMVAGAVSGTIGTFRITCRETSEKCCQDLRKEDFQYNRDQTVCASSKIEGECAARRKWAKAQEMCEAEGARLCTYDEMEAKEAASTGCKTARKMAWTADKCKLKSGRNGYVASTVGSLNNDKPLTATCLNPRNSKAKVVCCADQC